MITITAVIRAQKGQEARVRAALLAVASSVQGNEPETIGFYVSQDEADPCLFTTYERFADAAAMARHNASAASAAFFTEAGPLLDGTPILVTAREISSKR